MREKKASHPWPIPARSYLRRKGADDERAPTAAPDAR
jgi:hypothetical protein